MEAWAWKVLRKALPYPRRERAPRDGEVCQHPVGVPHVRQHRVIGSATHSIAR